MSRSAEPPLESWKEVAAFLNVSVRTAQYWEREKGLPIRRLPGEKARVWADAEELRQWRSRNDSPPRALKRAAAWRTYGLLASAVLLLAAAYEASRYFHEQPGVPVRFRTEPGALTALDAAGRVVWHRIVPAPDASDALPAGHPYPRRQSWFGDVDGDDRIEAIYLLKPERGQGPQQVIAIDEDGTERWRYRLSLAGRNPVVTDFDVAPAPVRSPAVFIALCSEPDHRGRVLSLDCDGRPAGALDFPGHVELLEIRSLRGKPSADLLIGGFDRTRLEALLMIADARAMAARAYCRFPRSSVNRLLADMNRVYRIGGTGDTLEVGVEEFFDHAPVEIVYRLNGDLKPQEAWFSESFRGLEKRLVVEGRLAPQTEKADARLTREITVERVQ